MRCVCCGQGACDTLRKSVIEDDAGRPSPKRRRNDDAASDRGFFRFAETVELGSFDDALQDRVSSLAKAPRPVVALSGSSSGRSTPPASSQHRTPITAIPSPRSRADATKNLQAAARHARFRIIQPHRPDQDANDDWSEGLDDHGNPLPRPPTVVTVGSKPTKGPRILDAVQDTAPAASALPADVAMSSSPQRSAHEMSALQDLLKEYMTLEDHKARALAPTPTHAATSDDVPIDDDGFVYDVYYRVTGAAATSALDPASAERIGALSGLAEDELDNSGRGDSDSDAAASDDEDSNEEDFYRNDYPEGEGESSEGDDDDSAPGDDHGARSSGSDYDLEYDYR